jgi:uncharacterized membrane protein
MEPTESRTPDSPYTSSDVTALSHLYRGELYRSTVWRTRLDTTTNWAVATTGIALTVSYASPDASPLPLVLVGLLVAVFLSTEARRYCFFDFWRVRAHVLELHFFGPILRGEGPRTDNGWNDRLDHDYRHPQLHITLLEAAGRRIRRTYGWIFAVQLVSYIGKLLIHPIAVASLEEFWQRAMIGPIPGQAVIICGVLFHAAWIAIAATTLRSRRGARNAKQDPLRENTLYDFARGGALHKGDRL